MQGDIPVRAFEEFVLQRLVEHGKHPEMLRSTGELTRKDHLEALKPFEPKLKSDV